LALTKKFRSGIVALISMLSASERELEAVGFWKQYGLHWPFQEVTMPSRSLRSMSVDALFTERRSRLKGRKVPVKLRKPAFDLSDVVR